MERVVDGSCIHRNKYPAQDDKYSYHYSLQGYLIEGIGHLVASLSLHRNLKYSNLVANYDTMQQYQDAIKNHKAGRPVAFEELPTPPGYAPIPGVAAPPDDEPTENFSVTEVMHTTTL